MKRVISACLEQTIKFESEMDYSTFIRGLENKHLHPVRYKIVKKETQPDHSILVGIIRECGYPVGDYLNK